MLVGRRGLGGVVVVVVLVMRVVVTVVMGVSVPVIVRAGMLMTMRMAVVVAVAVAVAVGMAVAVVMRVVVIAVRVVMIVPVRMGMSVVVLVTVIVIVRMTVIVVVVMVVVVAMTTRLPVRPRFRPERRPHGAEREAEALDHPSEDRIGGEPHAVLADLHRDVAIAEVIGGAGERERVVRRHLHQFLDVRLDAHARAVLGDEHLARPQRLAALEDDGDLGVRVDRLAQAVALALGVRERDGELRGGRRGRPGKAQELHRCLARSGRPDPGAPV